MERPGVAIPSIGSGTNVKAGVIALDVHHCRLLLIQSNRHFFGFPKGQCQSLETLRDCAQRELEEETSLTLNVARYHAVVAYKNVTMFLLHTRVDDNLHITPWRIPLQNNDSTAVGWIRMACIFEMNTRGVMPLNAMTMYFLQPLISPTRPLVKYRLPYTKSRRTYHRRPITSKDDAKEEDIPNRVKPPAVQ
jgi:ADP-ribose pyrophosphatase YjhB (NUDIX family)